MKIIYIEKDIIHHPRAQRILQSVNPEQVIECDHYKEVFNPRAQNFRIQKQLPALILAKKEGKRVFVSPPYFGIGGQQNYYFSHLLNCPYDCRYCFLQGMYSSAHYVLFINYEDVMEEIRLMSESALSPLYFFSGYDCDSLALEPITWFAAEFLPFFRNLKNTVWELRTKSTQVRELLSQAAYPHAVVAFSFTPDEISREIEHRVPSVAKRIQAMKQVADAGWPIGLRFDPLIYHPEFKKLYQQLLETIFLAIQPQAVHSISTGPLRFPDKMYQKMIKLYPQDPLLSQPIYRQGKVFSYRKDVERLMKNEIHQLLKQYVEQSILFECYMDND